MIESLVVGVLIKVAEKVGDRYLGDVAAIVDEALRAAVLRLRDAMALAGDYKQTDQYAAAVSDLDRLTRADPAAAAQLAKTPVPHRQLRIEKFQEFLAGVWETAAALERPVAMPGFFNGTDWVSVIDARGIGIYEGSPQPPFIGDPPSGEREEATLFFADPEHLDHTPYPRAYIIRTGSDERRSKLVAQFTERFTPYQVTPPTTTLEVDIAGVPLQGEERIERVRWIDRKTVTVMEEDMPSDANHERARYAITSTEGLVLLRDSLAAQAVERMREDGEFETL